MRYRKNVNCLTEDELHDLREAFAEMYARSGTDPKGWTILAGLHGGPPTSWCRHGSPGFLTWHRALLLAFEDALLCHCASLQALPYWDWSSGPTTGVPAAFRDATYVNRSGDTVPNPLYSGPRPGGGQTARRPDLDTTSYADIATSAQSAVASATTFADFSQLINGPHGSVHVRTGGDMSGVPTAGFDPIFYFHHANVDRLWASWAAANPAAAMPASEQAWELAPFPRPFTNQYYTGADMVSTTALGYQYQRFCLRLPPFRLWDVIRVPWTLEQARLARSVRLQLLSHHMSETSFEVLVFVDDPKADQRTERVDNPAFAGGAGFLGGSHEHDLEPVHRCLECGTMLEAGGDAADHQHGEAGHHHASAVHHEHGHEPGRERFDVQIDITEALAAHAKDDGVTLRLVAVDPEGRRLDEDAVRLEGIELLVD